MITFTWLISLMLSQPTEYLHPEDTYLFTSYINHIFTYNLNYFFKFNLLYTYCTCYLTIQKLFYFFNSYPEETDFFIIKRLITYLSHIFLIYLIQKLILYWKLYLEISFKLLLFYKHAFLLPWSSQYNYVFNIINVIYYNLYPLCFSYYYYYFYLSLITILQSFPINYA